MKRLIFLFAVVLSAATPVDAYAGCGICRRGGCSDPCTASACTGVAYHHGSCGGCASMSGVVHSGCGTATSVGCAGSGVDVNYSQPAICAAQIARADLVDCGPVASYQVVMQPEYVTESRPVAYTEYTTETRYRTRTVSRQTPVEVQDYRTKTVMVPKTETKTIEYSVLVPKQEERQVDVTESVPVWNDVTESYTAKVPTVVDVPEEYTVRVPTLRDEQFTYTVQIPQTQTSQRIQRVTNAVPITKTRTINVTRPVTKMQMVSRDSGHWETHVEEVGCSAAPSVSASSASIAIGGCGTGTTYVNDSGCGCGQATYSYSGCGGCGQVTSSACGSCGGCAAVSSGCSGCGQAVASPCGSGCGSSCGSSISQASISGVGGCSTPAPQTITRRVWVPNVVTEEVAVVENVTEQQEIAYTAFEQQTTEVPYECVTVVYVPEQRSGTRKVVDYKTETRTRNRKVVQYNDESRTRTRKELSYKQETRSQTIPYVSYSTEKRTKEVSYTYNVPETQVEPVTTTRYETVQEEVSEEYTVQVPVTAYREQQVQVCRMVPKLVPITINPCQATVSDSSVSYGNGGCSSCSQVSACSNCGTPTVAPPQEGCGSGSGGCN